MQENLSNAESKLIKSLQQKKYRDAHGLFVAEGVKLCGEAVHSGWEIEKIVFTGSEADFPYALPLNAIKVAPAVLERLSGLKTPNRILAICRQAGPAKLRTDEVAGPLFVLDGLSDPGNLGTILRLCDWFGFNQLICSEHSAELYNPKVVQASMGSIFRVSVHYTDLPSLLEKLSLSRKIYMADMAGESIYSSRLDASAVVVMGSEAHGASPEVAAVVPDRISIPRTGGGESLNVAIATAIIAAELRRQSLH